MGLLKWVSKFRWHMAKTVDDPLKQTACQHFFSLFLTFFVDAFYGNQRIFNSLGNK